MIMNKNHRVFTIITLFGVTVMASLAAAQSPSAGIAFITDVKGAATHDANKAGLMAELKKGARLGCASTCEVGVMYLQSGKEFVLKGPGDFVVGDSEVVAKIGPPPKVRETEWKVSGKTVNALSQATSSASIRMRSIGADSSLVKPDAAPPAERLLYPTKTTVATLQPAFRWASASEKGPFEFELKSNASPAKNVYKSKATSANLKLPNNMKLQPDAEYVWTVKTTAAPATKDAKSSGAGVEIGSSTFKTLPAHSLALTQKRKPIDKAEFSDWLLYALTLQELGAQQDAAEVFARLAKERPDLPELAVMGK